MHISFLGNSFVYFNDLPSCVVSAARAAGLEDATGAEHTVGGERLSGHLADERACALLAAPADCLIVQDQSGTPGRASEEQFEESLRALDAIAERAAHVEHVAHGSVFDGVVSGAAPIAMHQALHGGTTAPAGRT